VDSKRLALVLVAAVAVAVLLATGAGGRPAAAPPSNACQAGDQTLNFVADGNPHQALLHVPRGARGRLPLVVAFHGARYGARFVSVYYGLSPIADKEQFAVLYPQASHNVFWELPPDQAEDVDAVRVLLDRAVALSCIDSSRIYATGASNGGGFTARLGCEMADRLAAIAAVAGGYGPLGPCHPSRPLPVLEIHGTNDQVVPYGGTGENHDGSVAHFLGEWRELNGCTGSPLRKNLRPGATRLLWTHCAGGSVVEHLRLARTKHVWPGGDPGRAGLKTPRDPRDDPTGVDAAEVVWDFVSRFRLPG
jgi:polyhydroxybutyrate depolymerase